MQDKSALGRACAMVRDLRRRCPWDRVQTRETIRPYLVEEVCELDHAIAEGEPLAIREEVADLLLHLAWQIVLGEELNEFTADQIGGDLEDKMRRRHPHLFALGPAVRWSELKRRELRRGALAGLPPALPSLVMAYRLQERAATVGFDWPDTIGPAEKVREELAEVEAALAGPRAAPKQIEPDVASGEPVTEPPPDAVIDEIGDLLFAVVNLSRKARVQPTTALDHANRKFRARFEALEQLAAGRGIEMATAGLDVLDRLWEEVKAGGGRLGDQAATEAP